MKDKRHPDEIRDRGLTGSYMKKGNVETATVHLGSGSQNGAAMHDGDPGGQPRTAATPEAGPVTFRQLFRFADRKDKLLMFFGTLAAIVTGCALPMNLLVYGQVLDKFITDSIYDAIESGSVNMTGMPTLPPRSDETISDTIAGLVKYFVIIGCTVLVSAYMEVGFWTLAAERQTRRIRTLCFRSILKQHVGWFDVHQIGEINTRLSDDIQKINAGTGEKFGTFVQWTTTFFCGYILGFFEGWELALVILSVAPLLVITVIILAKMNQKFTSQEQGLYAKAGAVAEEVFSAIRSVSAFGGERKECERYNHRLAGAKLAGQKKGFFAGICIGMIWLLIFSIFALAFWYGSKLVRDKPEKYTGGTIVMVFMSVLFGTMSLGNAAPNLEFIGNAKGAAGSIFELIDMESEIDSSSKKGKKPDSCKGNVRFENINFSYPARPEIPILQDFSLSINVGQTVALVGPSGCGKSTGVQLLQRFYDPHSGVVKLDGTDISELNIAWLRSNIGVVSQEPVLFATTIGENIRYGKDGATMKDVEQAAKEANAHDFISKLPEKYNTPVGERGAQLSGGQKQRIAIARALIRDPKVLLLDEATSALDTESEAVVQSALDKASKGRTTIVIAHRLSTIRNADLIVGIMDGQVTEMGNHEQLMAEKGLYYTLVTNQTAALEDEDKGLPVYTDMETYTPEDRMKSSVLRSLSTVRQRSVSFGPLERSFSRRSVRRGMSIKRMRSRVDSTSSMASVRTIEKQESFVPDTWTEDDELRVAEKLPKPSMFRVIKLNGPELPFIFFACLAAIFVGSTQPCFALIFSEILGNFAETDPVKQEKNATIFSLVLFGIGVIIGIAQWTQTFFFAVSGEGLTLRLREMAFEAMIRQDIGWFDDRSNQVGALTARLATDASLVRGASGQQIGLMIQSVTSLGAALVVAFIFGWKLACVVLAFLPLMIVSGIASGKVMTNTGKGDQEANEEGGKIAVETIDNIRTVASLTKEQAFEENYNSYFKVLYKKSIRRSQLFGFFFAVGQSVIYFAYAAAFTYGGQLVDDGEMEFKNVFRVFSAITFGGTALGRAGTIAPDIVKGKLAAAKMMTLFDRKPTVNPFDERGEVPTSLTGNVTFKGVHFRYPTRPEYKVLQDLTVSVKQGQTLALVGASGCGKSTTIQLLERFYDPEAGSVQIDNINTRHLQIQWMRSKLGLVSQEPSLFDASVRDNIAYGDNTRHIDMHEIIDAAKKANIHSFIEALPNGYETNVGGKGTQLSGGQKQRVAIARALVRNPKILLLDEATSALDTESEKIVQEALDRAQKGRTCIVIAHRLSTIMNSDIIAVLHSGQVVEQGTHSELMAMEGFYFRLNEAQNRSKKQEGATLQPID